MDLKITKKNLSRIEDVISESDYILRYEKGTFRAGYCILNDKKIIIVNQYYSLEGKFSCILDIIKQVDLESTKMSESSLSLLNQIKQQK